MAYATPQDMIDAYGEREMTQLSTPDGADMAGVVTAVLQDKLDAAAGVMDSYLRRRYTVPVAPVTPELRSCCCDLARAMLGNRGSALVTDAMRDARDVQLRWLRSIAEGQVTLDGAVPAGPLSGARVTDRAPLLGRRPW